jgi:hypothetical protein
MKALASSTVNTGAAVAINREFETLISTRVSAAGIRYRLVIRLLYDTASA